MSALTKELIGLGVEYIGDGIYCIDTDQVRRQLAGCYLVVRDGEAAFIECGTALGVDKLMRVVSGLGLKPQDVRYVMPTHVHLDHAGGAGALMAQLPAASLVVHPRGAKHMIDPSALIAGATAVYGEQRLQEMYGTILPTPKERVVIGDENSEFELGSTVLKTIDAPGHAAHHYAVWDEASRGLFSGDVFGLSYRELDHDGKRFLIPTTTPVQFDPLAWNQTLDKFAILAPECAYLTHYGKIGDFAYYSDQLRRGISDYVSIAESLAKSKNRHEDLKRDIAERDIGALRASGWHGAEEVVRSTLEFDWELNAQGLSVWLDRQSKSAN